MRTHDQGGTATDLAPVQGAGFYVFCGIPRPYNLPRKKVTPIKILVAPSIDSKNSTATSYKFDTPVSGGAYQDAREVTFEWNDA